MPPVSLPMTNVRICCYGLVAVLASLPACARTPPPPKEADVVAVVTAFYARITAAKPADVMRLIAPDAVFIESGRIETRAEYEMNHLPADIEFEQKVKATRGPLRVTFD